MIDLSKLTVVFTPHFAHPSITIFNRTRIANDVAAHSTSFLSRLDVSLRSEYEKTDPVHLSTRKRVLTTEALAISVPFCYIGSGCRGLLTLLLTFFLEFGRRKR